MESNNRYPFVTKNQIKARLASDRNYALSCLVTLWNLQTAHEKETLSTQTRNHRGFASSHVVAGSKLAQKIQAAETLTAEDEERALKIVSSYTKQLAAYGREQAIEQNPDLATQSACFFTTQ